MTEKIMRMTSFPEPGCECFESEDIRGKAQINVAQVAASVTGAFFVTCAETFLCADAQWLAAHEMMLAIATTLSLDNKPGIEQGSREALWEGEHFIKGIEQRLLDSLRYKYECYEKMSPEDRIKTMNVSERVNDSIRRAVGKLRGRKQ